MKDLSFEEVLAFYQDNLNPKTKEKVLMTILHQPAYQQVLEAFSQIESELADGQSLFSFFKKKQEELYPKIFG